MAVAITRTELSARELWVASSKAKDGKAARRILGIALVLVGVDRKSSLESCDMSIFPCGSSQTRLGTSMSSGGGHIINAATRWSCGDAFKRG